MLYSTCILLNENVGDLKNIFLIAYSCGPGYSEVGKRFPPINPYPVDKYYKNQ